MAVKPMHGGIISLNHGIAKLLNGLEVRRFSSTFRAPNDSERLSTCPAVVGLISERGRKDR